MLFPPPDLLWRSPLAPLQKRRSSRSARLICALCAPRSRVYFSASYHNIPAIMTSLGVKYALNYKGNPTSTTGKASSLTDDGPLEVLIVDCLIMPRLCPILLLFCIRYIWSIRAYTYFMHVYNVDCVCTCGVMCPCVRVDASSFVRRCL